MQLTDAEKRALGILARFPDGIMPGRFAELMWPASPSWRKVSKCGNRGGATRGTGIRQAGGAYLAKLGKKGLAESYRQESRFDGRGVWLHRLSPEGRQAAREAGLIGEEGHDGH